MLLNTDITKAMAFDHGRVRVHHTRIGYYYVSILLLLHQMPHQAKEAPAEGPATPYHRNQRW
jgi:hypothetical protein